MTPKVNTCSQKMWRMNRKYLMDKEFENYVKEHMTANIDQADLQDKPRIGIVWDSFF